MTTHTGGFGLVTMKGDDAKEIWERREDNTQHRIGRNRARRPHSWLGHSESPFLLTGHIHTLYTHTTHSVLYTQKCCTLCSKYITLSDDAKETWERTTRGLLETGPEGLALTWATVSLLFFCLAIRTIHYTLKCYSHYSLNAQYPVCCTLHTASLRSYIQTMQTTRCAPKPWYYNEHYEGLFLLLDHTYCML